MPYCNNCGSYITDSSLFCSKCGQRVGVVLKVQQQQPFQSVDRQQNKPFKPNSNIALAIITTVVCCVPIGIYAIILANRVETLYYDGEYEKAEMTAQDVKKWSIIGMVISALGFFAYIIILIISFFIVE